MTRSLHTVSGPVDADSLGLILPHEHLFTDLRGPSAQGYAQGDPDQVIAVVKPYLDKAAAAGVTALVECSTLGVGRNLPILQSLSRVTSIRIVAPTGVYREAYTPESLLDLSEEALAELWTRELMEGIDGTSIRAGFIKLAMSDDGPRPVEIRNLKAAVRASQNTGAVIASHTIGGTAAMKEIDVLEQAGLDLHRFIWIHAQTEPNVSMLLDAASRGAYVELDSVGAPHQSQAELVRTVIGLIEAGFIDNILLSHDAGWYNPARADGLPDEGYRGYAALVNEFIPTLWEQGVTEEQVMQMTRQNPWNAFAF